MKKLLIFVTVITLMLTFTVGVFAESSTDISAPDEVISEGENTPEEENATEGEISGDSDIQEAPESSDEIPVSAMIVKFIEEHFDSTSILSLAATMVVYIFYEIKQRKMLKGSVGTLNNNAIQIAESSVKAVDKAFTEAQRMLDTISEYKTEFAELLNEIRKSAEEKESLEATLHSVNAFMKAVATALKENSDEVMDLLLAANIPNAVKNDMYKRHKEAEEIVQSITEV